MVEDDNLLRAVLQLAFERRGYTVLGAATVAEGLALAATHSPDAVLTDFQLPDDNGLELCRALRKQNDESGRYLPVWLMTGSHELSEHEVTDAGAEEVFRKPFKAPEACDRITRFLRNSAENIERRNAGRKSA
jgi:two-component system KDP operon response regulator KdpE